MNNYSMSAVYSKFLTKVYGWMSVGLLCTALTAVFVASSPWLIGLIFSNPLVFYALIGAQFGLIMYLSFAINSMNSTTAKISFMLYSFLTGLTLSSIFFIYTASSIAMVFFITSGMFSAMAIYGHYTQSDLTGMGNYLTMILFGMIISGLVNMFLKNSAFDYVLSALGVIVFTLLTAYDAQKIKELAYESYESEDSISKYSIFGALTLYLDFINLFIYMLRFLGRKRD